MSSEKRASSLKVAMPAVMDGFTRAIERDPNTLRTQWQFRDTFGMLARTSSGALMERARLYVKKNSQELTSAEQADIVHLFTVASEGIGTVALFSEVCVLKVLENPKLPAEPEQLDKLIDNSYPFIQTLIDSGTYLAAPIMRHFLIVKPTIIDSRPFTGAVIDRELVKPEVLDMFELQGVDNRPDTVLPVGLDETVEGWIRERGEPPSRTVTCPAQLTRQPKTDRPYTRVLFDALLKHETNHVFPGYIPTARDALARHAAESEPGI